MDRSLARMRSLFLAIVVLAPITAFADNLEDLKAAAVRYVVCANARRSAYINDFSERLWYAYLYLSFSTGSYEIPLKVY